MRKIKFRERTEQWLRTEQRHRHIGDKNKTPESGGITSKSWVRYVINVTCMGFPCLNRLDKDTDRKVSWQRGELNLGISPMQLPHQRSNWQTSTGGKQGGQKGHPWWPWIYWGFAEGSKEGWRLPLVSRLTSTVDEECVSVSLTLDTNMVVMTQTLLHWANVQIRRSRPEPPTGFVVPVGRTCWTSPPLKDKRRRGKQKGLISQ